MTVEQAEGIIQTMSTGVQVALRHRFAGDKGTILRLDNYAMVNVFDDGRYYIQGDNTEELVIAFGLVETPWDPDSWSPVLSEEKAFAATQRAKKIEPKKIDPGKRFEF